MAESSINKTLDDFLLNVQSKEPNVRLECFPQLEIYLTDDNSSIDSSDLTGFIDGLIKWIEGSNFKVKFNL